MSINHSSGFDLKSSQLQLCNMGRNMATRMKRLSIIPEDLKLFEVTDIPLYFEYLTKTFHLSGKWEKHYKQALLKVERGISEEEFFFQFIKENLEGALKVITLREEVTFAIARYLIKPKIEEKRKEQEHLKNFYRNGEWKTK